MAGKILFTDFPESSRWIWGDEGQQQEWRVREAIRQMVWALWFLGHSSWSWRDLHEKFNDSDTRLREFEE